MKEGVDMDQKPCNECLYYEDCMMNMTDAIKDRQYSIRDGKDCWTSVLILLLPPPERQTLV